MPLGEYLNLVLCIVFFLIVMVGLFAFVRYRADVAKMKADVARERDLA